MRPAGLTLRGGEPDTRGERGGSGEDRSGLENFATTLLPARHGVFLLLVLQCAIADIPRIPGRPAVIFRFIDAPPQRNSIVTASVRSQTVGSPACRCRELAAFL
jgi:hypothetical protein